MKITVRVKPGSKRAGVRKLSATEYEIAVIDQPEKGRATNAARRALAEFLHVPQSRISLLMGASSKMKLFEVL